MSLSDPPTTNVLPKLQPRSAGQECMVSMYVYTDTHLQSKKEVNSEVKEFDINFIKL